MFVGDVVKANLLAATVQKPEAVGQMCNIASGKSLSLNKLFDHISQIMGAKAEPVYANPRAGDVRYSSAETSKARRVLDFEAGVSLGDGLAWTIAEYRKQ